MKIRRVSRRRLALTILAVAVAVAAASVITAITLNSRSHRVSPTSQALASLVAAVGAQRTIEARVTGGFAYGALQSPLRSPQPSVEDGSPDLRIAVAEIEKLENHDHAPETLALRGLAYLAIGDVERAIPLLEEAAAGPSPTARTRSDLSAAYLARAHGKNNAPDLLRGLVAADLATTAAPALSEAWFNRALALERLHLVNESKLAWQDYLRLDDGSEWAGEARTHLQVLNAPRAISLEAERRQVESISGSSDPALIGRTVKDALQTAREWTEDQLLVSWPLAARANDSQGATLIIIRARRVAAALAGLTGDQYLLDAVKAVERSSFSPGRAAELSQAHGGFRRAMEKYENNEFAESGRMFAALRKPLERARSPFAVSARLQVAISAYYASDVDSAVGELNSLIAIATPQRFVRFLGLAHRMRGLLDFVRARFGESMAYNLRALEYFQASGDDENVAAIQSSLAENLDFLGEPEAGWANRLRALSGLSSVRSVRRRHTILISSVLSCLRQDAPQAAAYFQAAVLENARRWNKPELLAEAYVRQGEVHGQAGSTELVARDFAEARHWLEAVPDGPLAKQFEARILLASASFSKHQDSRADALALSEALVYLRKTGMNWAFAKAHLARGKAYESLGEMDLAEADFREGMEEFEKQRASLSAEALRVSYFDQPWDLFSEMVRLQVKVRKRPDLALGFAERGRARTLLESVARSQTAVPLDVASLQRRLKDDVAVVYYSVLPDELLIWRLTRTGVELKEIPIAEHELARLVTRFRAEADRKLTAIETSTKLFDLLIAPVLHDVSLRTTLVFVPDGVLHTLPFSALRDARTGRYVIQDRAVVVAPSASVFVEATEASHDRTGGVERNVFVVGDPLVTNSGGPFVPDLPEAKREVDDIAKLYATADTVTATSATKQRFLDEFDLHDIVHFAGHAISNADYPDLSRLLFATTPDGTSGSLFAHEIAGRRFRRTEVLVLAACQTSGGRVRRGEGVLSLARPFLAAGVSTVVASLWDVDDRATRALLVSFHEALRDGASPAHALQAAQLSALSGPDVTLRAPSMWAGFVVVGSPGAGEPTRRQVGRSIQSGS